MQQAARSDAASRHRTAFTLNVTMSSQSTTPIGYARYADEFFAAALAADDRLGTRKGYEITAPVPVLYLTAHAIELALKGFLLHKGRTIEDIKALGHDLEKCLAEANDVGLADHFVVDAHDGFTSLNALYRSTQLTYIQTGYKQFPVFGTVQVIADGLIEALSNEVGWRRRRDV